MALESEERKADPNRRSIYQFVPEEYRIKHSLSEDACVCASRHCHRKVGLRGEPGKPGRKAKTAAEICKPAEAGRRKRPSIIVKLYQVKGARCAVASHAHRSFHSSAA